LLIRLKSLLRPLLFTLGGVIVGYLYYKFIGCNTGSCVITSDPVNSMVYMGVIGLLLSGATNGCCGGSCSR